MAKYVVTVIDRFVIETNDLEDVRSNYECASFDRCESIQDDEQVEYLDGTFTVEEAE